jgi:Holliday junction resolvase RusA-like endonuclease
MITSFFVRGLPIAKGSARAFVNKYTGRAIVVQTNKDKQRPWASAIGMAAIEAGLKPVKGPVFIAMTFYFPRPKSHYRTGKRSSEFRDDAPTLHDKKPDADKLKRCVYDALTTIAYEDDCQIAAWGGGNKFYTDAQAGCNITFDDLRPPFGRKDIPV